MACRSSCPEAGAHATWGECARAANIKTMYLGGTGPSWTDERRFRKTNESFRTAVADGLNPAGVNDRAINAAYDAAAST